ncbi:uncharacterized protein LOC142664622 [Rhinoderma darwinii]|uniref:uncharacterized protein LOC142655493 n=1 Tax=Rhinoderma darwinii TaxID=43563 RepID=UPI003F673F1B
MDVLLMELIRRAESEGGENWLRQCLAAAPSREVEGRSELTGLEDDIEEAVSPAGSSLEVPSSAAAKRMKSAAESSLRVERSSGRSLQVPELERRRPTVSSKKVAHSAGSAQQVPAQLANPLARSLVRERETTGWSGTPSCSKDGVEDTAEAPASLVLEAAQDFSSELQPRKRSRKTRVAYSPPPPVSRRRRGPRSQLSCQQVSPGSTGTQQEVAEAVHDPGQVEQSGEMPATPYLSHPIPPPLNSNVMFDILKLLADLVSKSAVPASSPADVWKHSSQHLQNAGFSNIPVLEKGIGVSETCCKEVMSCDISPLGFHLQPAIKERIWRNEFIDLFSLLPSAKETLVKQDGKRLVVWILGHSFIFWAQKRAARRSYTENLSMDPLVFSVFWHGVRGLQWKNVFSLVKSLSSYWPDPNLIIIHAGGNDLGKEKTLDLLWEMRRDIALIKCLFPDATISFSEIIPRLLWSSGNYKFLNRIRKRINRAMSKYMSVLGGLSYRHSDLEDLTDGLFRNDCIHLSDVGIDIFNLGLQNLIEEWLRCFGGAMSW